MSDNRVARLEARRGKPTNDYLFPVMKASNLYYVDLHGRVWTKKKLGGFPIVVYSDRWRRAETAPAGSGRPQIRHFGSLAYASRFVWFWFNGKIPKGLEVDHKNNNKLDNHPLNLQLLTRVENQRKAERDGLIKKSRYPSERRKAAQRKRWKRWRRENATQSSQCSTN